MDPNNFPTKGNLILAKNSLSLAKQGYELMDKKRNILIRELLELIDKAKNIQSEIDITFNAAYQALQRANIEMGIRNVEDLSSTIPEETSILIKQRSIMGTDIPLVEFNKPDNKPTYSFYNTRISLDEATSHFIKVKELTLRLAMIENSAYRLAANIKKTQKRANALKNITIPYFTELARDIQNSLEEREREEFTRLKVIKHRRMTS
ncbi:V-type ATP synthase subunit D [Anaerocolumna sedimenticola]|uniref:V-type ATP synthase subunit D n=1 Tax=Anaerocolumna sedimenticola TaxID=2696063 RepID=A0A6P1TIQ1_9FIRM|nr:V-type ATP synthase subunit D [Anaerocolumna sedimenticola]QHQ60303.1 V-type ATP synthase subunit D [Anaerocolumna sedimenticola]